MISKQDSLGILQYKKIQYRMVNIVVLLEFLLYRIIMNLFIKLKPLLNTNILA